MSVHVLSIKVMMGAILLSVVGLCSTAWSMENDTDPARKGLAIATEADVRDQGWHDNQSTLKMVLRNRHGEESFRELRRHVLESTGEGAGDKSLVIFDSPRDIEGTALLSHTRVLEADDQWLYLPALKRVKRISSSNKSGPFVGSEFAYEDMLSQEVAKYDYRWLRSETYNDLDCAVVERYPRYQNSGYTRQIVWFDVTEYRVQQIEFYDRKDTLLKTLTYMGYQQYLDRYWRPQQMSMVNHQMEEDPDLYMDAWEFQTGQRDAQFTPNQLKLMK